MVLEGDTLCETQPSHSKVSFHSNVDGCHVSNIYKKITFLTVSEAHHDLNGDMHYVECK